MKQFILLFSTAALLLSGCTKPEPAHNLQARLEAHSWRLTGINVNGKPTEIEDCQRDDIQVYKDRDGYDDRGETLCYDGENQRSAFTYTVSADEQAINVVNGPYQYTYRNIICNDNSLTVT